MNAISIVVPTLNETENVAVLVRRIANTFAKSGVGYEIIFIDDHSKDGTQASINKLTEHYPIKLYPKVGSRGKAYSLLQGFDKAQYDIICMIDADLQYPPEAILPMYQLMLTNQVDIVLTERQYTGVSKFRQLSTTVFNLFFTRLLFGFNYDSQSGLKLFRKSVMQDTRLSPTPWSFDMEFIVRALEKNFKILSHKIVFSERHSGEAKVRFLKVTYELSLASFKLKLHSSPRKIKRGYRMNNKLAEKAVSMAVITLLSIVGVVSFATTLGNQNIAATGVIRPTSDAISNKTLISPDNSPLLLVSPSVTQPPLLQPAYNISPQLTAANIGNSVSSRQLLLSEPSPNIAAANSVQIAETTYPLRDTTQTYIYNQSVAVLPNWIIQLALSALIGLLITASAYALVANRRISEVTIKQSGDKS